MSRFMCSCWALFLLAGWFVCLPAKIQAQAPEEKPFIKQPSLLDLAKLYLELELPLPPKDAKFARVSSKSSGLAENEKLHQIAFSIKGVRTDQGDRFWIGFREFTNGSSADPLENFLNEETFERSPRPEMVLTFLKLNRLSSPPNDQDENRPELIFAIQCHLLGHNELARFFYRRCHKASYESMDRTLVIAAWNYWLEEMSHPVRDRRPVSVILKRIFKNYEFMSSTEHGDINWLNRSESLLSQVELTVQPSKARPGSVEAMIDSLMDTFDPPTQPWKPKPFEDAPGWKKRIEKRKEEQKSNRIEVENKLSKLGFEAIPALIEHVNDKRLTRNPIQMNRGVSGGYLRTFTPWEFETVGRRVRSILSSYFEFDLGGANGEWNTKKEDYLKKWNLIKNKNEFEYLVSSIMENKCEKDFCDFIFNRFPEKSIFFYRLILKHNCESQSLNWYVTSIVDSDLPSAEKMDLLLQGARHELISFRIAALQGLLELDNSIFTRVCMESLNKLPKEIQKIDNYILQVRFAKLALCSEDLQAQKAVLKYVKNLSLSAKMYFLATFNYIYYKPSKTSAILFLSSFLDDETNYKSNEKDDQFYDGVIHGFSEIEVRNLAAEQILRVLDIKLSLDDKTTPKEWEKIRAFVKDEIERRKELEQVK